MGKQRRFDQHASAAQHSTAQRSLASDVAVFQVSAVTGLLSGAVVMRVAWQAESRRSTAGEGRAAKGRRAWEGSLVGASC